MTHDGGEITPRLEGSWYFLRGNLRGTHIEVPATWFSSMGEPLCPDLLPYLWQDLSQLRPCVPYKKQRHLWFISLYPECWCHVSNAEVVCSHCLGKEAGKTHTEPVPSWVLSWKEWTSPHLTGFWYYIKWKPLNNLPKFLDFFLVVFEEQGK